MSSVLRRFLANEDGSTAIEYGFIALIIGLGIISSLKTLPPALNSIFGNVKNNLTVN
jgi:pilus assembly protein Flp/PilA